MTLLQQKEKYENQNIHSKVMHGHRYTYINELYSFLSWKLFKKIKFKTYFKDIIKFKYLIFHVQIES